MELNRISISNFRSIPKDFELIMKPRCRVLIGINESGKSNILKALSLLCPDVKPSKKDIREPLPGEGPIKEAFVIFHYALSSDELKKVYTNIKKKILYSDIDKPILTHKNKKLSLYEFMRDINEVVYEVDLKKETRKAVYWVLSEQYIINNKKWKKPSKDAPATYKLTTGKEIELNKKLLIDTEAVEYKNIDEKYLKDIEPEDVNELMGTELVSFFEKNHPECVFWQYDDKNLLPSKINLAEFSSSPDTCLPLKHMFLLAKYDDIPKAFKDAKESNPYHGINNLLDRVAKQATKHFHSVWKDYKSIKFYLGENGEFIDAAVVEKNRHGFDRRSDGFKRFVTFLLMISARVKNDLMTNNLILIDEPGIGLHLSAQKYLREELINIAEKNHVVYSTHSIFMVDNNNISRHLIVKKEDEKTFITEAKESRIFDEEVLYNALGYSVFENLKQKNILFEGWRDKKLFQTAMSKLPSKYGTLKKVFKEVGFAHSIGASFIKNITPILEMANRECFIMSDADEPAKSAQRKFNEGKLYGTWKKYDEILGDGTKITGEDFIKKEVIVSVCKRIKDENPKLPELTKTNLEDSRGVIHVLKDWVKKGSFDNDKQKEIVDSIKERIFSELKTSQIKDEYYDLLEKLKECIK